MRPIASLPMWFISADLRSCHILVYDDGCTVQMRAQGEMVFARDGLSLNEAYALADALKEASEAEATKAKTKSERRDRGTERVYTLSLESSAYVA